MSLGSRRALKKNPRLSSNFYPLESGPRDGLKWYFLITILRIKAVFNLNSFALTGGPEGNGGSQHDRKCGGGGGGGGGGGPLNFRPGYKKVFQRKINSPILI